MPTIDPAWVPIRHLINNNGTRGCGAVGMYATRRYRSREPFVRDNFRLLDGSPPPGDGHAVCGACGSDTLDHDGWDFLGDAVDQAMVESGEVT